jgi:hypothetical protein
MKEVKEGEAGRIKVPVKAEATFRTASDLRLIFFFLALPPK